MTDRITTCPNRVAWKKDFAPRIHLSQGCADKIRFRAWADRIQTREAIRVDVLLRASGADSAAPSRRALKRAERSRLRAERHAATRARSGDEARGDYQA